MQDEPRYEILSAPRQVSMDDEWFDVAGLDHFWIERRFDVLFRLCGSLIQHDTKIAEIGCGSGLVQRQFEDHLDIPVDGFDLNTEALQRSISRRSRLACYDVEDRKEALQGRYDLVLLLDVIEHVLDERAFLSAAAFLASPGGHLVVNVPASPRLYSRYDDAVGHLRRYTPASLLEAAQQSGLEVVLWSYWGLPLVPLAVARKLAVSRTARGGVIRRGMEPPGRPVNRALALLSRIEPLPQKLYGTSLLGVFRKSSR
jgi:SAM-dependent methyltransferase